MKEFFYYPLNPKNQTLVGSCPTNQPKIPQSYNPINPNPDSQKIQKNIPNLVIPKTIAMPVNLYEACTNPVSGETFKAISFNEDAYTMQWILQPHGYVPF